MKQLIATALIALIPTLAPTFAAAAQEAPTKKIFCGFTEPFFTLEVDLEKKTVTRTEPNWEEGGSGTKSTVIAEGISLGHDFRDPLLPTYAVIEEDGSVILDLTLNMKGSDGMSEVIFPFDARHGGMWGGCSSDKIEAHDPHAQ